MSSLFLFLISGIILLVGYVFYAKRLCLLWEIDPKRPTPALSKYDGIDFVPAKNWLVLFGHHFSSIAGAGPIVGPVIACLLWGWLPSLIWIVLGAVFIGGVHDFSSLITSVREGAKSISEIADISISKRAKIIFSLFVWLALILVVAVFAYLCADTFVKEPKIVLPSLGLIPVAILFGFLIYYLKKNLALCTILGLILFAMLIYLGEVFPLKAGLNFWLIVLFVYSFFASILPVNILLQPRDYLCSFLLFLGMGLGYLGIFISQPKVTMPAYLGWSSKEGLLFPMLFVTIACGAISGFHSLISSGTTSKQLPNERYARKIAYGAMIAESMVSVLAIISVASLFTQSAGFTEALKNKGPINIFVNGYNKITTDFLFGFGEVLAFIILNSFILTTLDTATRITRYIGEELFKIKNRFISTLLVVFFSGWLAFGGRWQKLWLLFGASNQLVASLALFVVTCWLILKNKRIKIVLLPAIFMFITTVSALFIQAKKFYLQKDFFLFITAGVLILLSLFMLIEVLKVFVRRKFLCQKV